LTRTPGGCQSWYGSQRLFEEGVPTELVQRTPRNLTSVNRPRVFYLLPRCTGRGRGKWRGHRLFPLTLHPYRPPLQNPTVMPGTGVPPTMMAKVKEAMTSTSEKIFQLRSTRCPVFREPSADFHYTVGGIVWEI